MLSEIALGDVTSLTGWLQVLTNLGFGGLAYYLITVDGPNRQTRFDEAITRISARHSADIEALQKRFDVHAEKQLAEFKESIQMLMTQIKFAADKHDETVKTLITSQEKQIDRLLDKFSKCPK